MSRRQRAGYRILEFSNWTNSKPSQNFDTWSIFRSEIKENLNGSDFELFQNSIPSCEKSFFDDLLSNFKVPPVLESENNEDANRITDIHNLQLSLSCLIYCSKIFILGAQRRFGWLPSSNGRCEAHHYRMEILSGKWTPILLYRLFAIYGFYHGIIKNQMMKAFEFW